MKKLKSKLREFLFSLIKEDIINLINSQISEPEIEPELKIESEKIESEGEPLIILPSEFYPDTGNVISINRNLKLVDLVKKHFKIEEVEEEPDPPKSAA